MATDWFDCLPGSVAHAAVEVDSRFTPDLAYEMAQITARVVAAQTTSHEGLKAELAYATALITTKVMPLIPSSHQSIFAYEMAKITTRLISDKKQDVERSKAEYAFEMAQLTAYIISAAYDGAPPTTPPLAGNTPTVNQRSASSGYKQVPAAPVPSRTAPPSAVYQSEPEQTPAQVVPAAPVPSRTASPPSVYQPEPEQAQAKVVPAAPAPSRTTPTPAVYDPEPEQMPAKAAPAAVAPAKTVPPPRVYQPKPEPAPVNPVPPSQSKPAPAVKLPDVTFSEPQLRNNADIVHSNQPQAVKTPPQGATPAKPSANPGYVDPATYNALVDDLTHIGKDPTRLAKPFNVDGEVRYHYTSNRGSSTFNQDSSGLRIRVAADTALVWDWRLFTMVEMQNEIKNYGNDIRLSRLYASGTLGIGRARVGRFGYLMADGNIYDSGFKGIRYDVGSPVNYTLAVGATDDSEKTTVVTAHYRDIDYDLEAGIYNDRPKGGEQKTILNLGGNYYLDNFSLGAMYLRSSQADSKGNQSGYVFSLHQGDLKTWRPGTYSTFIKYYSMPRGTYISHGMNGLANKMQGFMGFGAGVHYTFAENLVGALEYYRLKEKTTGKPGDSLWMSMSNYF